MASWARITNGGNPLDSYAVSDFDGTVFCSGAEFDDFADSLVATDLAGLSWVWETCPAVCHDLDDVQFLIEGWFFWCWYV